MRSRNSLRALLLGLGLTFGLGVASGELRASQTSDAQALQAQIEKQNVAELVAEGDQIIGLEAIVADGSDDAFYSRFGHAMLRFVKSDGNFATDKVLSLVANVDVDQLKISKGIFGGYPVLPLVDSFGDFWKEYVETEHRSLKRYVILSTPAMRAKLIARLDAWYLHPKESGDYTFLNNNCVGALAKLLEQSGFPSVDGAGPVIPANFDTWLSHSLLSPFPGLVVRTTTAVNAKAEALLGVSAADLASGKNWPDDAAGKLNANLSDVQIKQLLNQFADIPYSVREDLVKTHNYENGQATFDDVMTFRVLPPSLYGVCGGVGCMDTVKNTIAQIWSAPDLKKAAKANQMSYWLAFGFDHDTMDDTPVTYREDPSRAPPSIAQAPEIVRYYQLLLTNRKPGS